MLKLKFLLLLYLCAFVVNCTEIKCDNKDILDLRKQTRENKDEYCKDKICVFRLCQKPDKMITLNNKNERRCATLSEVAKLKNNFTEIPVYKMYGSKKMALSEKRISDFQFVVYYNFTAIIKNDCLSKTVSEDLHLLEDGSLLMNDTVISPLGFVAEFRLTQKDDGEWVGPHLVARILLSVDEIPAKDIFDVTGLLTSCVFLILVLVVYSSFKQLRQGQYVKIFMAYIACLAITYALTAFQRLGLDFQVFGKMWCKCVSSLMYYSLMATYFWLNVIAFEIWNAFRPKNEFRPKRSREADYKFLKASLYAFGMALLMLIGVIILDEVDLTSVKPMLGDCMHSPENHRFHYIPITIILCVNLVFFAMTTYHFCHQKIGKTLNSTESRTSRRDRNNFSLYIKLTASVGLDWFLDLINMFVELPEYLNYLIDTYANFMGVILFIILCVCNKNVLYLVSKRFNINNRFTNHSSTKSSTTNSSSKRRESNKLPNCKQHNSCFMPIRAYPPAEVRV